MHAVLVRVTIDDDQSDTGALQERVVPAISQEPGFVAGYWTRDGSDGLSMTIWESEDAASSASERVRSVAPEGVTVEDVQVREVVASA